MGDDKLEVRVTGRQFDKTYYKIRKETAAEGIPNKEVFNRAERELYDRANKLGIDLKQPYSDFASYTACKNMRLRNHKRRKQCGESEI